MGAHKVHNERSGYDRQGQIVAGTEGHRGIVMEILQRELSWHESVNSW